MDMPRRIEAVGPASLDLNARRERLQPRAHNGLARRFRAPRRTALAIGLLVAALLLGLAAAWLSAEMVEREVARRTAAGAMPSVTTDIWVAARDLDAGTRLSRADVRRVPWPAAAVTDAQVAAGDAGWARLEGQLLDMAVSAGAPLPAPRSGSGGALAARLGRGMRAVSLSVTPEAGLAGLAAPGDQVDLLVTIPRADGRPFARTAIRNLRLLGLDQLLAPRVSSGQDMAASPPTTVTLEATPAEAEAIALLAQTGTIRLALRPQRPLTGERGVDAAVLEAASQAARAAALGTAGPADLIPPPPAAPASAQPAAAAPETSPTRVRTAGVEVFRGSSIRSEAAAPSPAAEPLP